MRLRKSLELAWNILAHSKLRSWLTIIGIVIGIAAVVSIVSISEGAQQTLSDRFGELGADIITVSPGFSKATTFRGMGGGHGGSSSTTSADQDDPTNRDIITLKNIPNIDFVMGTVSSTGEIKYLGSSGDVSITGVSVDVWKDITTDALESGRYLTKGDVYSVVLGNDRANTFFDDSVQLNRQITIEGKIFKVVGILKKGESDTSVTIPISAARTILDDVDEKEFNSITVKVEDMDLVDNTIEVIEKKLMLSRGILREDDRDFTVSSIQELQETITQTLNMMALFLGAIAAISLVVGGVGISNTMFTSVLEKTREIGVMKAIGAKNRDILIIFLFNSGMIGLVGGIGGVIVGSIASGAIGILIGGSSGGVTRMFGATVITPELLIFAFLFSVIIGMIAGVIPAYRASRLKPVDALRYE